jgi:DNA-binding IclR family transcriptional regulator
MTANTIVKRKALEDDLAASLSKGYFVTRGENVADVMAVACTVEVYGDVFGIAVAAPLSRMHTDEKSQAERLLATIDRLRALGDGG